MDRTFTIALFIMQNPAEYMQAVLMLRSGVPVKLGWTCEHGNTFKGRAVAMHPEKMAFSVVLELPAKC